MNYKTISGILAAVALYCLMQAFGLIVPLVNFVTSVGHRIAHMVAGG